MEQKFLDEMFNHYIVLQISRLKEVPGSYNEAWCSGACDEAKRWLEHFNVDVSYSRVQREIKKMLGE